MPRLENKRVIADGVILTPLSISGMPEKLLGKIDRIAQREHRSRSGQMIALLSEIVWTKYGEDGERKKTDDD
jgi:metal-responsive CopG/Arc/MetJ family transcriptional regulator